MKKTVNNTTFGSNIRLKLMGFVLLCAVGAMVWTFIQVGKQASTDQSRIADVSKQLLLSQQMAKYALAATTSDTAPRKL